VTGTQPPRVLIAKPGLDGHDRGAKVVAFALRDAGCEVIYLGLRCSAQKILAVAAEEDVDVIGISVLSGAHVPLAAELIEARRNHQLEGLPIVLGGIVTPQDADRLREMGLAGVYPAGTPIDDVVTQVIEIANESVANEVDQ
jgi:methylmalonyl-CoA mutase, C-terminal domain